MLRSRFAHKSNEPVGAPKLFIKIKRSCQRRRKVMRRFRAQTADNLDVCAAQWGAEETLKPKETRASPAPLGFFGFGRQLEAARHRACARVQMVLPTKQWANGSTAAAAPHIASYFVTG